MTIAVIGATGRVGSEIVRGILARGEVVTALVRDPGKAHRARIPSIEQVTRLSVLNTSADSLGINQRAHYSIDQVASSTAVPYSTIRPAIFSASLLAEVREARASRTWSGIAGSGRMALIDHRDAAEAGLRVLTEPRDFNRITARFSGPRCSRLRRRRCCLIPGSDLRCSLRRRRRRGASRLPAAPEEALSGS